jgi:hypothetical protein
MARIRTIKPDFWRDEALASISPEACLLAIGLLNHCDDEGYFNANPKLVESDIFPLREMKTKTTVLLQELFKIGYLVVFQGSDGKTYGCIKNFEKHQVINKKTPSKIKHLCELQQDYGSSAVVLHMGKERKGKEQAESCDSLFESFWVAYPNCKRKGSKSKCDDVWSRHGYDGIADQILGHLASMATSDDWTKMDGQFIPAPLVYLNKQSWDGWSSSSPVDQPAQKWF